MSLRSSQFKPSTFWLCHILGWLFLSFSLLFFKLKMFEHPKKALMIFLIYGSGFLASYLLRYVYRAINYQNRSILSLALIVIGGSFFAAHLWYAIERPAFWLIYGKITTLSFRSYIEAISWRGLPLFTWSVLYFGVHLWVDWKNQEADTAKANALAQKAQLQMLRYQLNPHFLFNSLNSIRALIDEDENAARDMLTELSEFLRYSLVSKNYSDVPLKLEMEAIQHYFEIEKKRYEDKIDVQVEMDPRAEDYPVLSFIIHPIVENAVKFGMQTSPKPLKIRLNAKVPNGNLVIEVINSGKWIPPDEEQDKVGTGTGLENVRQRLENAFPGGYKMEIFEKDRFVHVRLEISGKLD